VLWSLESLAQGPNVAWKSLALEAPTAETSASEFQRCKLELVQSRAAQFDRRLSSILYQGTLCSLEKGGHRDLSW
jgi:hypothetical protein